MGKTAAQLTSKEIRKYRESARQRDESEMREMLARHDRALSVAREAARVLKEKFGVTRVILFGSLATESWFHIRSDVDLAAEGLKREEFWRADCLLETIGDGFEIDLVNLNTAPPGLKEAIHRDGIEL